YLVITGTLRIFRRSRKAAQDVEELAELGPGVWVPERHVFELPLVIAPTRDGRTSQRRQAHLPNHAAMVIRSIVTVDLTTLHVDTTLLAWPSRTSGCDERS